MNKIMLPAILTSYRPKADGSWSGIKRRGGGL